MLKLRLWLGILVWWLFLFWNIERINEPIDLASFVYVLAPLSAGVVMVFPRFFKGRSLFYLIVPMLIAYFVLKIVLDYPILNQGLPLTVTEISALLLTLLLTKQIGYIVWGFEDTITQLTFQQTGIPPRLYDTVSDEELYREVKRSRRFGHPLTLLVVKPQVDSDSVELSRILVDLQKTMVQRYILARVAKFLSEELRDTDLIALHDDEFVVLLPETVADDARAVAESLKEHATDALELDLEVGLAAFPDDNFTIGGLLATASNQCC